MSNGRFLDSEMIARAVAKGKSKEQIAAEMGLPVMSIKQSLRQYESNSQFEPEATVRARWAKLLPKMRKRLKAEIASFS